MEKNEGTKQLRVELICLDVACSTLYHSLWFGYLYIFAVVYEPRGGKSEKEQQLLKGNETENRKFHHQN